MNPAARRAAQLEAEAARAFHLAGMACEIVHTREPGHAGRLAAEHGAGKSAVFTLGGDGTSMEVMDALAHSGTPIGILPGGTGNLVARALGTPLRVERAVRALLQGATTDIDLGCVDGRRFAFSTGVGVDARMVQETPPALKRRYGVAAYALIAARVALQRRPFHVRVDVDGDVIEGESVSLFVANFGTVLSGLLTLGPQIRPDDGCLDLCQFSPSTTAHALHITWRLVRSDFRAERGMLHRRGRRFRVECTPPQLYQADGEVLGHTPFTAHVEPLAARLLVPLPPRGD